MEIDAQTFRTFVTRLLPEGKVLSPDEAASIIQIAQLAGGVDLDEDPGELRLERQLARYVASLGGLPAGRVAPVSPLPLDREERRAWIARLAAGLDTEEVGQLAYVIAYLVTIGDLEIAPVESTFLEELRAALGIGRDLASDLVVSISSMITPGVATASAG